MKKLIFLPLLVFFLFLFVFIYSFFIEPEALETTHTKIDILPGNGKITLVQLTDFHIGENAGRIEQIKETVNALNPDIIVLTGDYVNDNEAGIKNLKGLMELKAGAKYAVLGNHDYGLWSFAPVLKNEKLADKVEEKLEEMGFVVLRNEIEKIEINGYELQIIGLDDVWAGKSEYRKIKDKINETIPTILLSHQQDAVENFNVDADLVLSGHTHGGQIVLPFIGSLPKLFGFKGKYPSGLHREKNYWIYVSKGVSGSPRFLCRPEITVLELI